MPYKLFKKKNEFCVRNSQTGEDKGCSKTLAMAKAHMRALYAHEKEVEGINDMELDALVDIKEEDIKEEISVEEGVSATAETDKTDEKQGATAGQTSQYPNEAMVEAVYGPFTLAEMDEQEKIEEIAWDLTKLNNRFDICKEAIRSAPFVPIEEKVTMMKELVAEWGDKAVAIANGDNQTANNQTTNKEGEIMDNKARADVSAADKKRAVAEYGNVTYADPVNKKYPLGTVSEVEAAWRYIHMPRNSKKYSSSQLSAIKRRIIAAGKKKIGKDWPPSATEKKEIDNVIEYVADKLKGLMWPRPDENKDNELINYEADASQGMMIYKEDSGLWRWLARYSNKFRDEDNPPEIISEVSHKSFVDKVLKGEVPYPEMQLFHIPAWKLGVTDWIAYDDSGFAVASGTFNKEAEPIAEIMSQEEDWLVSHGMPFSSIKRDEKDPTIIIEHITKEISPLPGWAAANKMTGFTSFKILKEDDNNMSIPKEFKQAAIEQLGIKPEMLEALEKKNAEDAAKAKEAGIQFKEKDKEEVTELVVEIAVPVEELKTEPAVETTTEVTEPIVEAKTEVEPVTEPEDEKSKLIIGLTENLLELNKLVAAMQKELQEVKDKSAKTEEFMYHTPSSSLNAILAKRAVGAPETRVKGSEHLAHLKPKHTDPNSEVVRSFVPFLDKLLKGEIETAESDTVNND